MVKRSSLDNLLLRSVSQISPYICNRIHSLKPLENIFFPFIFLKLMSNL